MPSLISIILRCSRPSSSLDKCRLPSQVSFDTLWDQVTADTSQGEFDFNPFPFDVGMLGVLFCPTPYTHSPDDGSAPLLDRMTTRFIDQRFKTSEALKFFEDKVIPRTPEDILSSWIIMQESSSYVQFDIYDRRKGLDPEFVDKWAAYCEPSVPRHVKFLRYICEYPWAFDTISYIRRFAPFVHQVMARI
ncbi:hypothetical protein H0H87_003627 [Tephrocybe sp. NHM501043]|nr:hypothetical protein H0H87_003627 [Tephrocybe sp. NHM501043]